MVRYAFVAILWLGPALVAAQNTSNTKTAADALFFEGKRLIADGNVDLACQKFEASLQIVEQLGVRLNLADCHERQGRTATAWTEFREAAAQAAKRGDNRAGYARRRADALVFHLAKLAISVPSDSQLPGLTVQRDHAAVPSEAFGRPIPVDPGSCIVEASAPGYQAWSTQVDVTPLGQIVTVEVPRLAAMPEKDTPSKIATAPPEVELSKPLIPKAATPVANAKADKQQPTKPAVADRDPEHWRDVLNLGVGPGTRPSTPLNPPATSPASRHTSSMVVPLVVGTGALVLLGGGLRFELWAESRYAATKSEMMSQPRREALYNSANEKRYAAEALAASGLVAGGTAVWLYLHGNRRKRDPMTDVSVHVVPTATGLAFLGKF